jgi:hypothetical protein
LCAVDNPGTDDLLDVALLRGRQIVVDDHHIGLQRLDELPQFFDFALPEKRRRVDIGTHLVYLGNHNGAGTQSKLLQFEKRFPGGGGRSAAAAFKAGEDSALGRLCE